MDTARFWQFVISFEETTFFRENDFVFPVMISMCTQHQPQVASREQAGYHEAKYHGSKVKKKLNYHSFKSFVVMNEKTQSEHCRRTTRILMCGTSKTVPCHLIMGHWIDLNNVMMLPCFATKVELCATMPNYRGVFCLFCRSVSTPFKLMKGLHFVSMSVWPQL